MKTHRIMLLLIGITHTGFAQNVGVGTPSPTGKLHIKSATSQTQLVIEAAPGQSQGVPMIILRSSNGSDRMQIRVGDNSNLFMGFDAGKSTTTGGSNVGLGSFALTANVSGGSNIAIGPWAMQGAGAASGSGGGNIALGNSSLEYNDVGYENIALGTEAMRLTSYGIKNVAIGARAMWSNSGGNLNVAIGENALYHNNSGVRNIALGAGAGVSDVAQYGNTISIGNHNYLNAAYNQAFLGNLNTAWTGGNVGWSTFSDARIKNNIREEVKGLDFIKRLRPVTYYRSTTAALALTGNKADSVWWEGKDEIEQIRFSGFIAQEVEQAAKESGYDFQGVQKPKSARQLYSLSYETFVVPLVKATQELLMEIEILKEENRGLKLRLERIEEKFR